MKIEVSGPISDKQLIPLYNFCEKNKLDVRCKTSNQGTLMVVTVNKKSLLNALKAVVETQ